MWQADISRIILLYKLPMLGLGLGLKAKISGLGLEVQVFSLGFALQPEALTLTLFLVALLTSQVLSLSVRK